MCNELDYWRAWWLWTIEQLIYEPDGNLHPLGGTLAQRWPSRGALWEQGLAARRKNAPIRGPFAIEFMYELLLFTHSLSPVLIRANSGWVGSRPSEERGGGKQVRVYCLPRRIQANLLVYTISVIIGNKVYWSNSIVWHAHKQKKKVKKRRLDFGMKTKRISSRLQPPVQIGMSERMLDNCCLDACLYIA